VVSRQNPASAVLAAAYGKTTTQAANFCNEAARRASMPERRKARTQFANAVAQEMKDSGANWDAANVRVQRRLASASTAAAPSTSPAFSNEAGAPVFGHQMKAIFNLPMDATQSECDAAWKGNGGTATPMHSGKVFGALVELAQKEKGLSYDAAISAMKARCPSLWAQCEALSQTKS
jgi:hypothetical protein